MSAKSDILASVRAAIAQSQPAAPEAVVVRDYVTRGAEPAGSELVVAQLVETLEDYHAHVSVVTAEEVAGAIDDFLEEMGARTVVVPDGLPAQWKNAAEGQIGRGRGRRRSERREVREDSPATPLDTEDLAVIDAVVTSSRTAISPTGTIVLDGQPDQGRRVISLLPDVLVCVVAASTVEPTVPQAVAVLAEHPERPLTWIAGPSATSDIELVRVDGVHGPRTLCVVIATDL